MTKTTSKAKVTRGVTEVEMPAGDYWIGDPCYAVPDDRWMEWLEASGYETERVLIADLDGFPVLGIGTAYGDGCYLGSDGNSYPVDAGLIGVVPVEVPTEEVRTDLMTRRTFAEPFTCRYQDGTIVLGPVRIETGEDE